MIKDLYKNVIKDLYKNDYKQYKKTTTKPLTFEEWWTLTGLIEKEQGWLEATIEEKKKDIRYCREDLKSGYGEENFINERLNDLKKEVKDLRKDIKQLKAIASKINY